MRHARLLLLLCITAFAGCVAQKNHAQPTTGRATVLWISIDGLRPDYLDRTPTPFLHRLMNKGVYTRQLETVTPTLTFPSHLSEATGVTPDRHGIPANEFYDLATHQRHKFPADASLLQAEPIWLTARRQGVRTLVYDWPMSQKQAGQVRTDYFLDRFDSKPTDDERMQRLLSTWRQDIEQNPNAPLRLLMGYVKEVDHRGHSKGPNSAEVLEELHKIDSLLDTTIAQATQLFHKTASIDDRFFVLITTDHGMAEIKTLVSAQALLPKDLPTGVVIIDSGPLAMIYFDNVPAAQKDACIASAIEQLRGHAFLHAYRREELPPDWHLAHPTRTGDVVLLLKPGYSFSSTLKSTTGPATSLKGMHGYLTAESRDMLGFAVLWQYKGNLGGRDLGHISALQFHPTVARLLGIAPAGGANKPPLMISSTP